MVAISLTAVLSPLVTAIAINEGVKSEYARVLKESGDAFVTRDNYGSNGPIELAMAEHIKAIQGVTRVIPRVIGRTYAQGKLITVLGVSYDSVFPTIKVIHGRKPKHNGEAMLGFRAAQYLNMEVGSCFSLARNSSKVFRIVGLFDAPFTIWSADLLVMGFEDASELFSMAEKATDLVVYTSPGYEQIVDIIIRASEQNAGGSGPLVRVQTRQLIERYTRRGFDMRAGVFAGFYSIVLALAIPSLGIISGFGLAERTREIGIIKALGWQTTEVQEAVALENLLLSLTSVPLIMLASLIWIHLLNGVGVVTFLIPNMGIIVPFPAPSRVFPIPFVLALILAPTLTMVGSVHWTWRAAVVSPMTGMKA
jgi:ABC-type lipoprotein release transport system permease subunit